MCSSPTGQCRHESLDPTLPTVRIFMVQSLKYSHLVLRLGLAAVFLWFGIDKFLHPGYWADAWLPQSVANLVQRFGLSRNEFMYLNGLFEIIVGTSIISTIFVRFFAALAILFLISVSIFHGFNEIIVRDLGLMGGLLALIFWPDRRY
jgi:uncharacterized membrane protein YphA (DoxX/SURF4 family)